MIIKVKLTILTQNWNFKLFLLFLDEPGIKVNKFLGMTFQNVQFGLKENRNKARSFGKYIFLLFWIKNGIAFTLKFFECRIVKKLEHFIIKKCIFFITIELA